MALLKGKEFALANNCTEADAQAFEDDMKSLHIDLYNAWEHLAMWKLGVAHGRMTAAGYIRGEHKGS